MSWMVNDRKLKAAIGSMHQLCQSVRAIFPGDVDDRVVEAVTLYLYTSLARDLFGPRFAAKLHKRLSVRLKYATAAEVEGHLARITKQSEAIQQAEESVSEDRSPEEMCRAHSSAVIASMLDDAGFNGRDPETHKKAYIKFDEAILEIRKHLIGIKEQNYFVMTPKSVR